jgi:hypothetical protein
VRALGCLLLLGSLVHATDLSQIDRKITAIPKFGAEEQFYAILVLGPEATTRVWFIADGDNLYVDKNGNGDLTDDGEPVHATASSQGTFVPLSRSWKVGALGVSPRYTDVEASIALLNPSWRPAATAGNREHMERFMEGVGKIPHVNLSSIHVMIDGKLHQFGHAMFRTSPDAAPVFHADAPLTLGLVESILPTVLRRGEKPDDLVLAAGTPGFSGDHSGCFSYLMYDTIPAEARPVIEVEFPSTEPGKYLKPQRFTLDGKC